MNIGLFIHTRRRESNIVVSVYFRNCLKSVLKIPDPALDVNGVNFYGGSSTLTEAIYMLVDKSSYYHHGNLRRALLVAAQQLLQQGGIDKVTLRAVAKNAGVSQAAPYHHFANKEALLAAIAEEGYRGLIEKMHQESAGISEAFARLQHIGVGYVQFAVANPFLFRLMHRPQFQAENTFASLHRASEEAFAIFDSAVQDCNPNIEKSELTLTCAAAWSIVHGAANLMIDGRLQALTETHSVAELTNGILAHLNVNLRSALPSAAT